MAQPPHDVNCYVLAMGPAGREHLLERRNPLPEINLRVVEHDFVPPCCTRRYPSSSGPASKSVKRIGFARCSVYPRGAASRIEAPRKASRGRAVL